MLESLVQMRENTFVASDEALEVDGGPGRRAADRPGGSEAR
jgi:hypothetical protein